MTRRQINLVKSVFHCPTNFSLDCLIGLKNSSDPRDRRAYDEAMSFMVELHDKLGRILEVLRIGADADSKPLDENDDPFTP